MPNQFTVFAQFHFCIIIDFVGTNKTMPLFFLVFSKSLGILLNKTLLAKPEIDWISLQVRQ